MPKSDKMLQQLFLIVFLYTTSYQVVVLVAGGHGILLHRKLQQTEFELAQHYEELERHQRDLLTLSERIRSDPSYITIEARGLGYYELNDKLILINTWQQAQPAPSPGTQLKPDVQKPSFNSRVLFFYAFVLSAILWLLIRVLHFGRSDILPKDTKDFRPEGRRLSFHHNRALSFGGGAANGKNSKHSMGSMGSMGSELLSPGGPYMPKRPDQQDSFQNFRQ